MDHEFESIAKVKLMNQQKQTIGEWCSLLKNYLVEVNDMLITDRSLLVILESQIFQTTSDPVRNISLIVS